MSVLERRQGAVFLVRVNIQKGWRKFPVFAKPRTGAPLLRRADTRAPWAAQEGPRAGKVRKGGAR